MLEGKTRIAPVDVETLPDDLRETLEEQRKLRGAPLCPIARVLETMTDHQHRLARDLTR